MLVANQTRLSFTLTDNLSFTLTDNLRLNLLNALLVAVGGVSQKYR